MKKYLYPANLLLPKRGFEQWAVIACDQYTSNAEYWADVEKAVGESPSTLRMVLPEIYLSDTDNRVNAINATMRQYLDDGVFNEFDNAMVYIERKLSAGGIRKGILGLIDLSEYEYEAGKKALVRATEQTVAERIPPRVKIRRDAPLEFPHVLIFIDDPDDTVMKVCERKEQLRKLYDFNLMKNGGHIEGYLLDESIQDTINNSLGQLVKDGLLFAVGDGNHSLATAKVCSELNPSQEAKFALVEIVNIHNPAIEFEPIYRVVFGTTTNALIEWFNVKGAVCDSVDAHKFTVVDCSGECELNLKATSKLPVGTLQALLDEFIAQNPNTEIDYIHGTDDVKEICRRKDAVGFIFDGMRKSELFDAVIQDGSLPRKTFSMGHADDKRFYIEGRKIR